LPQAVGSAHTRSSACSGRAAWGRCIARDPRLGRDVALKVLPDVAVDPERLGRFEREARAAAALNHPNILAVYDVGQADGRPFLVSELLQGETLRERLAAGPLPLRKVVDFAVQIARGLAAAHEKGIVHRDLKPENLFITSDDRVKILDFGLAKLTRPEPAASASGLATAPVHTSVGVAMGTAGYMSPEQVRGLDADARSDLFAFGVVLYEMLTGRRAFQRGTAVETMSAILNDDPPEVLSAARPVPKAVSRIITRCLEKAPASRFQSAADLGFALEHANQPSGTAAIPSRIDRRPRPRHALRAVALTGMLAASYTAGLWRAGSSTETLQWQGEWLGGPAAAMNPRLSPDGQMLAFEAIVDGLNQVGVMRLQSGQWTVLTSDRESGVIFDVSWAPDSSAIYFDRYTDAPVEIYRVPVLGGDARLIVDNAMTGELTRRAAGN
jgi:serine/threonine protein kinase